MRIRIATIAMLVVGGAVSGSVVAAWIQDPVVARHDDAAVANVAPPRALDTLKPEDSDSGAAGSHVVPPDSATAVQHTGANESQLELEDIGLPDHERVYREYGMSEEFRKRHGAVPVRPAGIDPELCNEKVRELGRMPYESQSALAEAAYQRNASITHMLSSRPFHVFAFEHFRSLEIVVGNSFGPLIGADPLQLLRTFKRGSAYRDATASAKEEVLEGFCRQLVADYHLELANLGALIVDALKQRADRKAGKNVNATCPLP